MVSRTCNGMINGFINMLESSPKKETGSSDYPYSYVLEN